MVRTSVANEVTNTPYSQASWRSSAISTKPGASWPSAWGGVIITPARRRRSSTSRRCRLQPMRRTLPCLPLPAGTGIAPVAVAHRPLEHPLDPLGQAQLEQIGLAAALRLAHRTLIAPIPIAAQQPGRTFGPEPIQQRPQPGSRVLRRVPVAGLNLDLQHQPQIGQHVAVVGVRRPPRLLRIVANHRALLMAVEQLHRGVDIEDPRLAQQRPGPIREMLLQPPPPRFRRNPAQRPTDRV